MKLEARDQKGQGKRRDALVVFASTVDKKTSFETVPEEVRALVAGAAPPEAGAEGALFSLPAPEVGPARRIYVFGAGKETPLAPRKARGLLRTVVKSLNKNGETSALIDFPFALQRMEAAESRDFLLRTLLLSDYVFPVYKSDDDAAKRSLVSAAFNGSGPFAGVEKEIAHRELVDAEAVAELSRLVRDLGNTPSNDMVPRHFADRARREAKKRGVKATILDKKAIARERMGGLLAVNRGAAEEPRLVVLEYHGAKKGEKPIALVGKGVTFDSGGISIKPAERMGDMKWDMLGAATVLGVVLAAAELKLRVNLVGVTPLTENLPSGTAYKPGDIVRFRNGKTAEIDNTDAEGRVILADALDYVSSWKPQVIVDYATLTGAALVALGLEASIVFTDDHDLARELISAGERTDERLWRLPLWEDYKENIRSEWADFKNTGGRYGGSINGALFLKEFVSPKTPWAHLDIAPTAYFERDHAGYAVGATAFGLAQTLRWLRDRTAAPASKKKAKPA